jgi:hypothetical protein
MSIQNPSSLKHMGREPSNDTSRFTRLPRDFSRKIQNPKSDYHSGITHCGGADIFFRLADSAISCMSSRDVELINLEAD